MKHDQTPDLPRITVVTPSFNQGRFLDQCIQSVLNQGYPNLEYMVFDGGSTDGSLDVLRKHHSALAYWTSNKDSGQADAINQGFRRATGEVVAWLNADDFYLPGAFHHVAEAYRRNPAASFYFGNGWRTDESGTLKSRFFPSNRLWFNERALLHGLDYILQPATFINRQHLVAVDYLNPALRYGLDYDLWLRLARLARPAPVRKYLAASREYAATKTAAGGFERAEELRRLLETHSGVPLTPGALAYYLHTLQCLAERHPEIYPSSFLTEIMRLSRATGNLFARYDARPDGFPFASEGNHPYSAKTAPADSSQAVLVRNWIRRAIVHCVRKLMRLPIVGTTVRHFSSVTVHALLRAALFLSKG